MAKETIDVGRINSGSPGFDIDFLNASKTKLIHLESLLDSSESIVHDINNQLAAIVALSDLISRMSDVHYDITNKVAKISESAKIIVSLTEKWTMLSKGHSVFLTNELSAEKRERAVHSGGHTQRGQSRKMHILLVDDEEVVCAATEEMLKRLNYDVTSMRSGAEAIEYYEHHWEHIDLIVLDMMMPEMDGVEVFSKIRKVNPDANVLVSSGYSDNDKARILTEQGARGYLQKPFRLAQLSETVRSVLKK
ncbi:MAG: response regulator [Deltaproteobacteria bacterium]|nr:response regulator [Deltaproteobacteria bacterium]MBN2670717.1 response regulator [Deltaproteobacteria bacterium]